MDRFALLGADLFFCLFGVFAAIHATAPDKRFGQPERKYLELSWPAETSANCLFALSANSGGSEIDLRLPQLSMAADVDGTCIWRRMIDGVPTGPVTIVVSLPYSTSPLLIDLSGTTVVVNRDSGDPALRAVVVEANG